MAFVALFEFGGFGFRAARFGMESQADRFGSGCRVLGWFGFMVYGSGFRV